jgi:hypothetical protein
MNEWQQGGESDIDDLGRDAVAGCASSFIPFLNSTSVCGDMMVWKLQR